MPRFLYYLSIRNADGSILQPRFEFSTLVSLRYWFKYFRRLYINTDVRFSVYTLGCHQRLISGNPDLTKRFSLVSLETFRILSQSLRNSSLEQFKNI